MPIEIRRTTFGSAEYHATVALRYEVLRRPLGLQFTQEELACDVNDIHLSARNSLGHPDSLVVACLILSRGDPATFRMRQVAVSAMHQGHGIGRQLVRYSEQVALEEGASRILLHARETALQFYLSLGYQVEGEPFEEVGIRHRKMFRHLA